MNASSPSEGVRAVLLAAGFATRLHPLTLKRAKPLLEVGGVPMLTRMVRQLTATGLVTDITVVVNGRFAEDFEQWRKTLDTELPVQLVNDGVQDHTRNLGAIADLDLALGDTANHPTPGGWLVAAGDNLFTFDLTPFVQHYLAHRHPLLLLRDVPEPIPPRRYSEVTVTADGTVTAFREKPDDPRVPRSAIAVYLLPPELPAMVKRYLAGDGPRDAPGHFLRWLVGRGPVEGMPITGKWFDIGNAEDLARARDAFRDETGETGGR